MLIFFSVRISCMRLYLKINPCPKNRLICQMRSLNDEWFTSFFHFLLPRAAGHYMMQCLHLCLFCCVMQLPVSEHWLFGSSFARTPTLSGLKSLLIYREELRTQFSKQNKKNPYWASLKSPHCIQFLQWFYLDCGLRPLRNIGIGVHS